MLSVPPVLILGASSRVARFLRVFYARDVQLFNGPLLWHYRRPISNQVSNMLVWDMLHAPTPEIPVSGVICLAGGPHVAQNAALAQAAVDVARGAPVLIASTQAVYGPQTGLMHEVSSCQPQGAYGETKLAAEQAVAQYSNVTCLRIGNVIGADALLRNAAKGPVRLDRFADGQSPKRMMIGPLTLGRAFADLLALGQIATPVLNLAQPGLVAMADLLDAAEAPWQWQDAPATAIPSLEMDLTAVQALIDLPPAAPEQLVAEARAAGWGTP